MLSKKYGRFEIFSTGVRSMRLPKILITGSKGKIGAILTRGLADSFDIYGLDKVARPTKRTFRVDISNYAELEDAFHR